MLEVNAIDTYRGPAHILNGVSLRVDKQEVVCLVGRNGAGKTTTIESIMGFLPLRSGQIVFQDEDVTSLPPHERAKRGIGYSPEDCGVFPELSVGENLMISRWLGDEVAKRRNGGAPGPIRRRRRSACFPRCKDLLARQGLHLSGGQRKMVAVARAMMISPTLLLLDEAFEGLAPVVVNRFTEAVMKIKAMGISILMAESHLAAASRIGDRLYAIDRGEIIFHGSPKDALADEKVIKALRGVTHKHALATRSAPGLNHDSGYDMASRCSRAAAALRRRAGGPQRPRAAGLSVLLSARDRDRDGRARARRGRCCATARSTPMSAAAPRFAGAPPDTIQPVESLGSLVTVRVNPSSPHG